MDDTLRYRLARPIERFEPYAFLVSWPILFFGPYWGAATWGVAFAPGLLVDAYRTLWKTRAPVLARPKRGQSSVELVSERGAGESIAYADVEALTSTIDKDGHATELRVERRAARALVFEVPPGSTPADVAARLGIDAEKARSRFALATLLAPRGIVPLFLGFALLVYTWVGSPSPEIARPILLYFRYVFLPLVVVYAIPTTFDVARDGVAWRWLFVKRYLPFSAIGTVGAYPPNATFEKIHTLEIRTKAGGVHRFVLGKARAAWITVREAFEASKRSGEQNPDVDAWLVRDKEESVLDWTRRLAARGAGEGTYRRVDVAHLWTIAEDPAAPVTHRCAAVIVLGSAAEARERLRVLATQSADPDFRALLEACAAGAPSDELAVIADRAAKA